MPAEEGLVLDVNQNILPREEPREENQKQPCGIGCPSGLDLALKVKGELLSQENVFRFDRSA
jgi:hypothetical protein